jgi:hypothetical protein
VLLSGSPGRGGLALLGRGHVAVVITVRANAALLTLTFVRALLATSQVDTLVVWVAAGRKPGR